MSFLGDELIFDVINAFTPMDENAKWHKLCGIPNALVSGVAGTLLAMAFIGTGALLPFVLGAAAISAAVCVGMNLIGKAIEKNPDQMEPAATKCGRSSTVTPQHAPAPVHGLSTGAALQRSEKERT